MKTLSLLIVVVFVAFVCLPVLAVVPAPRAVGVDNDDLSLKTHPSTASVQPRLRIEPVEKHSPGQTTSLPAHLRGQAGAWNATRSRQATALSPNAPVTVWVNDNWAGSSVGSTVGGHTYGIDAFATIQEGIDSVAPSGTVNVFPGDYDEFATGRFLFDASGPYQFGLFVSSAKGGITIQGVDDAAVPVSAYAAVVANVKCNATNGFGESGVFVEGDNVTITGLNIFQNPLLGQNKSIEVIGESFTFKWNKVTDGNSLYMDDWRFDSGTNTSWVKSYTVEGNSFAIGTSIDIASGFGFSGPTSGRKIVNNTFDLGGNNWNAISFNGSGTGVPWFIYSVGGATITGNTMYGGTTQYIRARGTYDNSQFDWKTYFENNSFDRSAVIVQGADWANSVREYSYTQAPYTFDHARRIGATIQGEVDQSVAGDDVKVGPGTYIENVLLDRGIALTGKGQANCTIIPALSGPNTGTGSLPAGASNLILVQADNVTVSGLTLDGDNPALTSGIVVGGADLDARNGIITNYNVGVFNNLVVHDVTVKNIYLRGIYASSGGSFDFNHNTVQNVKGEAASIAMFNYGGAGSFAFNIVSDCNDAISANHSRGTQFLNNQVTGSASGLHTDNAGDGGGTADLIKGNSVSNSSTNGYGIFVFAPYITPTVEANTITNVDVGLTNAGSYNGTYVIFKNNIVNGMGKAGSTGLYVTTEIWGFASGNTTLSLLNNAIYNNAYGSYMVAEAGFTNTINSSSNAFYANANSNVETGTGTMGAGTFVLDMGMNWWGTASYTGVASAIINGQVDYTPWLASGTDLDGNPATGFQGDFSSLWVDDDSPQLGSLNRIQEAVNKVIGSTVNVAPGLYPGQVVMNGFAALNLIGSGIGVTTVQAPPTAMTQSFVTGTNNNFPILFVENSANVKIAQMTIDGAAKGNLQYRFVGVAYRNAGGSLDTTSIIDIRDNPFSGSQHGVAVYAFADDGNNRVLNLRGNTISGFQKGAVVFLGANLIANIDHSVIAGAGPTTITAQNGIQYATGAAGTASNNTVAGVSYTPGSYTASGLLAYGPGIVTLDHNQVSECQTGIYFIDGAGAATYNTIVNTPAGTGVKAYFGIFGAYATPGTLAKANPKAFDFELIAAARRTTAAAQSPQVYAWNVSNNDLDGGHSDSAYGINAYSYTSGNVTFTCLNNQVKNWLVGIESDQIGGSAAMSSTVHSNTFKANTYGYYNYFGTTNVQFNTFSSDTNAVDNKAGNIYLQNCWNDYVGVGPRPVPGGGGNSDTNPKLDCSNCCVGTTGDVNKIDIVDLSDLTALVSFLTGGGYILPCTAEANVNNIGIVDLADLTALVSFLTGGGFVLPNCPQ